MATLSGAAMGQSALDDGAIEVGGWKLRPTIEVRVRGEYRRDPVDLGGDVFTSSAVQAEAYRSAAPPITRRVAAVEDAVGVSERVRLGLGVEFGRLRAKVTLQDVRMLGSIPGMSSESAPGLRGGLEPFEGYLELRSAEDRPGFEARFGRQVIAWGDGRLLGGRDWWQRGAVLDAVRFQGHVGDGLGDLEVFAAMLAAPGPMPTPLGANDGGLTGVGAHLGGVRTAWHVHPLFGVELGALGRLNREPLPVELVRGDTLTADARFFGDHLGVSYAVEGAYQLGRVAGYGANRGIAAFAGAARLDWQTALPLDVRLGLSGAYASGDDSSGSGDELRRFDPILPDVHRHHGTMDLVGWSNLIEGAASLGLRPVPGFDASARYAWLALAEPGDRWTTANMLPVGVAPGNASRMLGHEIDVRLAYDAGDMVAFDAAYGLLLTGEGARSILAAAGRNDSELLHFGYVQASFRTP